MKFGSLVTVVEDGIHISAADLRLLGLFQGSKCWAVWLPNRFRTKAEMEQPDEAPEHLLLAPYHPSSWPALFRFDLRLNLKPESLVNASTALLHAGFNIIAYDYSPSGYHHAVWSIIAQDTHPELSDLLHEGRSLASDAKGFRSDALWDFANKRYAPFLLKRHREAVTYIEKSNKNLGEAGGFLHEAFVLRDHLFGGILYDDRHMEQALRHYAELNQIEAVSGRWLAELGYYWLYGTNVEDPLALEVDEEQSLLRVATKGLNRVTSQMARWFDIPVSILAVFDPYVPFGRLLPCPDDGKKIYEARIPYEARFKQTGSSKGLAHAVFKQCNKARFLPRHVTNTILRRTSTTENNRISIVGIDQGEDPDDREETLKRIENELKALRQEVLPFDFQMPDGVSVRKVGAARLFLSTRIDWERLNELLPHIERLARQRGFELVIVRGAAGVRGITDLATEEIKRSQAFLQVIPHVKPPEKLKWMLYELGVARGVGIPCEICVDVRGELRETVRTWSERLGVFQDSYKHSFRGTSPLDDIAEVLKGAINALCRAPKT